GMDLVGAFPNPFNPATTLTLDLAQTGEVTLAVYNVNGQLVRTLVNGSMEAGHHELSFDGTGLPSGLYLARLSTAQGDQVTRLILTK
ncbi:MAG: T9SS type A sorting domain-containing protein, partial [Gammaproteobacteria bacterium]|nr:T9SS type A sorting domain-containing protein [Gammaproteobacteria bacterium]